jgi:hypothetical protein
VVAALVVSSKNKKAAAEAQAPAQETALAQNKRKKVPDYINN